jgi:hypothetical protein
MSAAFPAWSTGANPQEEGSFKYRQSEYLSRLQSLTASSTPSPSTIPIARKSLQQQQQLWGPTHSSGDSSGTNDASSGAAVHRHAHSSQQPHSPSSSRDTIKASSGSGSGNTNPNQGPQPRETYRDTATGGETLWERAEHFFFVSPAQAALLCNVDNLASVVDEACTTSPLQPRDLQSDIATAAEHEEIPLGIARLCGPESPFTQHIPWFQQKGDVDQDDGVLRKSSSDEAQTAAARRWQRHEHNNRVMSRTHEDIEVSPGHHVQVRLPPTNPVIESPSHEVLYTNPKKQPAQQRRTSNSLDSKKAPTSLETTHNNNNNNNDIISIQKLAAIAKAAAGAMPVESLTVKPEEAAELERSISELTMRSSYAATDGALQKIPENRRMAYYAVGKHHRQSGGGGNRRCYFTGKLILGGAPFYAGSVLQGLRTLVVFCLPSAIGLPDKESILMHTSHKPGRTESHSTSGSSLRGLRLMKAGTNGSGSKATSHLSQYTNNTHNLGASHASGSHVMPPLHLESGIRSRSSGLLSRVSKGHKRMSSGGASTAGTSFASKSMMSRLSSLDDLSLSIEGDLDPNWSLDRDFLLKVLPPASPDLLQQMATLYPDQFETLPVQVRDASQWKLYVKFCFFSGLPISDGEMHYKIRDDIAEQVYGEEIVLSHDVMEASAGASAEILTLPNRTVIRYLRKHYAQQCSKLDDRVFQRASWERVAPEV